MKRIAALLLVLVTVLPLCACSTESKAERELRQAIQAQEAMQRQYEDTLRRRDELNRAIDRYNDLTQRLGN